MTRINTNVSALLAGQNLTNSNNQLSVTLTRLSTGLRINSAADDPSGMIAATDLGSNIAATQQAIANSQSASQLISTADSALNQISSLLTTINGLINQTANNATLSASQITANQSQIDASLSAINSIAQTTTFQGKNLLNGSLAFKTAAVQNFNQVQSLQVSQANFGTAASVSVDISVNALATQAKVGAAVNDDVSPTDVAASNALKFTDGSGITITAPATGVSGNAIKVVFNETANQAAGTASASFDQTAQKLTININNVDAITRGDVIQAAINADTPLVASGADTTGKGYESTKEDASLTGGALTLNTTVAGIATPTAGVGVAGLVANMAMEVGGNNGTQLFSFQAGATAQQMATAINQATAATGVTATYVGDYLQFNSVAYGSAAKASVHVVSEGTGGTFGKYLTSYNANGTDANGTDIKALVNGSAATGVANTVSLNTPALAFSASLDPSQIQVGAANDIKFKITGGGALFQLGPIVSSSQQADLGIQSVDTGSLGGVVQGKTGPQLGLLYELGSGQDAALAATGGPALAGQIVQAALDNVTTLRGQLGAFQAETLNSNISSLTNGVTNLTAAKSSIQDADFAQESASLSREQILVQSGTTVAGIASSTPANVLSLLQKAASV